MVVLPRVTGHYGALETFRKVVALSVRRFAPGSFKVQAGFDAHIWDPLEVLNKAVSGCSTAIL